MPRPPRPPSRLPALTLALLATTFLGCHSKPKEPPSPIIIPTPVAPADLTPYPARIASFFRTATPVAPEAVTPLTVSYAFLRTPNAPEIAFSAAFATNPDTADGPDTLAEQLKLLDYTIRRKHPAVQLLTETPTTHLHDGKPIPGRARLYTYLLPPKTPDENPERIISEAHLFLLGHTSITYRITYPMDHPADTLPRLQSFLNAFAWPDSITKTPPREPKRQ